MARLRTPARRTAAVLLPLAAGVLVVAWLTSNQEALPQSDAGETSTPVRVVRAEEVAVRPRARGYGSVQPARSWTAVADVDGRVVAEHPELDQGAVVAAGATLLRIDPRDYELAIQETRAQIDSLEAQLQELDTIRANLEASIAIQRRATELAERDYARARTLAERGTLPEATRDSREQAYLVQRRQLRDLENELRLIPSQRRQIEARLAELAARLERQRDDRDSTVVKAPFALRLAEVNVERDQYVRPGDRLLVGDGLEAMEVPAEVAIDRLRHVLAAAGIARDRDVAQLNERLRAANLAATIRLRGAGADATWRGRLVRLGDGLNAQTRTVQAVVRVSEPYKAGPFPLLKNMYVEVDIHGHPERRVVVPRAAVHDGRVYAVDPDGRLVFKAVQVAYRVDDRVMLAGGVEPGTRVVVDDLVPAVEGMRLDPHQAPDWGAAPTDQPVKQEAAR